MPVDDRRKSSRPRVPRIPIREETYRQPEGAAELPDGIPASAVLEREESAGEPSSPGAPKLPAR